MKLPLSRFVVFAFALAPCLGIARAALAQVPATIVEGAKLVSVYSDDRFFEGPAWDPKTGKLFFTAFGEKNQQILRLDGPGKVAVWLDKTEGVNGMYLANDGRLLGAQAYGHRVLSFAIGPDGPSDTKVLFDDKSLHQPNDIAQSPSGDIFFTDPRFREGADERRVRDHDEGTGQEDHPGHAGAQWAQSLE